MAQQVDFFTNVLKKDINIVKGDSLSFGFILTGIDGATVSEVSFTCKETPDSREPLFVSNFENKGCWKDAFTTDTLQCGVRIKPEYTDSLPAGRYFYDLEVRINEDVFTFMKGRLNVEYDVTR